MKKRYSSQPGNRLTKMDMGARYLMPGVVSRRRRRSRSRAPRRPCFASDDPARPLGPERLRQHLLVERARLAADGVLVDRGGVDAAQRGAQQADHHDRDDRHGDHGDAEHDDADAHDQDAKPDAHHGDGEAKQAENQTDPGAADDLLAPGLLEQTGAALDRRDRSDALDDQHGDDEEGDDVPRHAAQRRDDDAGDAAAFAKELQDEADGRGDRRVAEDGPDVAPGAAQAVAERRVVAFEADDRGAHEGRVEEDDDQVLDQVEQDDQHPQAHAGAVVTDAPPEAGEEAGDDERGRDDEHTDRRHDREDDQFLVLLQHPPAELDELPAAREATHACSSPILDPGPAIGLHGAILKPYRSEPFDAETRSRYDRGMGLVDLLPVTVGAITHPPTVIDVVATFIAARSGWVMRDVLSYEMPELVKPGRSTTLRRSWAASRTSRWSGRRRWTRWSRSGSRWSSCSGRGCCLSSSGSGRRNPWTGRRW